MKDTSHLKTILFLTSGSPRSNIFSSPSFREANIDKWKRIKNQYFYLFLSYLFFHNGTGRDLIKKERLFLWIAQVFKSTRIVLKILIWTNQIHQIIAQNPVFYYSSLLFHSLRNIDWVLIYINNVIPFKPIYFTIFIRAFYKLNIILCF